MITAKICENLRRLRKEEGLTQKQVADGLGYSRSFVAMVETDKAPLNRRQVFLFSRFYRVPVTEINPAFEVVSDSLLFD